MFSVLVTLYSFTACGGHGECGTSKARYVMNVSCSRFVRRASMGVLVVNRLFNGDLDVLQAMGGSCKTVLERPGFRQERRSGKEILRAMRCGERGLLLVKLTIRGS